MLYGYKRENGFSTVVGAALNKEKFNSWYDQVGDDNHISKFETDFMQHMTDEEFAQFQTTVFIFEHSTEEQQTKFIECHDILVGTRIRAIDRNIDMVNYDAPDDYDVSDERTIEELYGLDKVDKYDKRTDDQKEMDNQIKDQMKQMRKDGKLSDESFSPPTKDGDVHVTDIRTSVDADGNIQIDNVLAVKTEPTDDKAESTDDHDVT